MAQPQQPVVKVQAFRQFAQQLAAQVADQLCMEFEREVSVLTTDVMTYRNELARVAELLANQLGRERQLHSLLESLAGHHLSIANNANLAMQQQQPDRRQLHDMVEQMFGMHADVMNATSQGVNQALEVSQSHAMQAKQMQDTLISAEGELNRIMQLLSAPPVNAVTPLPTSAQVPQLQGAQAQAPLLQGPPPPQGAALQLPGAATPPVSPYRPIAGGPLGAGGGSPNGAMTPGGLRIPGSPAGMQVMVQSFGAGGVNGVGGLNGANGRPLGMPSYA
eukprot:TRINITY_DN54282_c0_g1_i1.p1 TRINITY_DN54282_c0_g1~~TRINITY_DN54282_c0_g1_i1.p1  ORF type:complete len:277 (-),score=48.90 TRINITY_DN54282_c0_g1_i1:149-979(-)